MKEGSLRRVRRTPTSWGGDYLHSRGLTPTVAWRSPLAPPRAARSIAPVRSPVYPEDSFPQVLDCGLQRSPWGALSLAALGLGVGSRRVGRAWWGAQVPLPCLPVRCSRGFVLTGFLLFLSQDRHDASSNGNPRIPHLSSAGQHLYSPAPPLSHTGVAEYQPPPYFPPPYQQLAYSQSADPYSHLGEAYAAAINPLHQPAPTGSQQQAWPGRQSQEGASLASHHGRPAGLLPHISGLEGGAVSARREAYRRSDLLLPHAHALEAAGLAENLGLHDMAHPIEEVQVSRRG